MSLRTDAEHIEKMYSLIAKYQSVMLFGANNGKVKLNFPKDFKFMTLDELIAEYKNAIAAGLPYDVVEKILSKIVEKQSPDNALTMMWSLMKLKHKPFADKTAQEVAVIIQSRAYDDFDRVLWENHDSIFDDLREENEPMVGMTYLEQRRILKTKVEQYAAEIKESNPNDLSAMFNNVPN